MTAWLILFIPLIAALVITFATRKYKDLSSYISIGAVVLCFILSIDPILTLLKDPHMKPIEQSFSWINIPGLHVEIGTLFDPLSILMLLVVTFVGSLIHIYSRGYMHGEQGFSRFFACMSLFIFSMLGIVLSNNFIQIFIFWELVGLSSYLLIGYYFEKTSASDAAKKAFLVNRVGDFGFILGIFVIFQATGTFNFIEINHALEKGSIPESTIYIAALLIFCGAAGKSAQFPLHVWLPDAMEGPTPVSALIHAATMVAAGVYLLARTALLYHFSPEAMEVVAYIGGGTALLAAIIAVAQNDIKRVIAYSTLSSLGYMVMAMGVGGMTAGMFYLTTHAFFKALLFLAAGSVIHALHTQDIWEMGGVFKKIKVTGWTFILGSLAMAGVFPFSGFWSKDEILSAAYSSHHYFLFAIGILTAFVSAFFMARLVFVTFFGKERHHGHPHESPPVMTWPLIILAFFAVVSGFAGMPWIEPNFGSYIAGPSHGGHGEHGFNLFVAGLSTAVVVAGIALGYIIYCKELRKDPLEGNVLYKLAHNKFYFDEFYDNVIVAGIYNGIGKLCNFAEVQVIIHFFVNGFAYITREAGKVLRLSTTGKLQHYTLVMVAGVVALILIFRIL